MPSRASPSRRRPCRPCRSPPPCRTCRACRPCRPRRPCRGRRDRRPQPDRIRSTSGHLLALDGSLTLRTTGGSPPLHHPGSRRHGVRRSHGPPERRIDGAEVEIRLTPRRPATVPEAGLTSGQPFGCHLFPTSWSMPPWESVRPRGNRRHGCPRSHGPGEERVGGAKVEIGLTARDPAVAPEAARAPAPVPVARGADVDIRLATRRPAAAPGAAGAAVAVPVARGGRVPACPSASPAACRPRGRAPTEVVDASAS